MKIARYLALIGLVTTMQACGTTVPSVQGTVTDLVTGQPIPDVDVVVAYIGGGKGSDGHYYDRCTANQITKTDANGHWQVEGRRLNVNPSVLRYSILLYKDGYREGSPGRYRETSIVKRITADKDVYEYDEGYQKRRDYSGVEQGWGSIEKFQKTWLTPNAYLADKILGSDNDHQILFYGCAEKGQNDPGLNALAQKFILKWLDTVPTEYFADYRNTCQTIASYVRLHSEFLNELHATEARSQNLKSLCRKTYMGDGYFDKVLGIK